MQNTLTFIQPLATGSMRPQAEFLGDVFINPVVTKWTRQGKEASGVSHTQLQAPDLLFLEALPHLVQGP